MPLLNIRVTLFVSQMESEKVRYHCLFPLCNVDLPSVRGLLSHMRFVHGEEKDASLRCHLGRCNKLYTTSQSYRKHVEREHQHFLTVDNDRCADVETNQDIQVAPSSSSADSEASHSDESCTISNVLNIFSRNVTLFALRIRETYTLPKTVCTHIMNDISSLFGTFHEQLSQFVVNQLDEMGIDISINPGLHRVLMTDVLINTAWDSVKTADNLRRYCLDNLNLIEGEEVILGVNQETGKNASYQYVPICNTLQHYIQHSDVMHSIKRYAQQPCDNLILSDYPDGNVFRQHSFFKLHPGALRLHFYIDDLEVCNPLGAAKKKHSLTVVYFQLGNVDPKYRSSLSSIHLVCVAKSKTAKKYGLHSILKRLAEDIQMLEDTGIEVTVDGNSEVFLESFATLSADNLASHEIGGFRCCFSSGRICRFCMVCYKDMKNFSSEADVGFPTLRNAEDHSSQLAAVVADASLSSVYGITKPPALHMSSFEATTSLPPDCMHDILEGVVPVVLKTSLQGLIRENVVSVDIVNDRLQRFKFGRNDARNVPPLLSKSLLKPSSNLAGSASQKWCFFRMLAFLIGDLVSASDRYWDLYLLCRKCVEIIFAPKVSVSQCVYLASLISDLLRLLQDLAPANFTPKCHFLTHYPRLIYQYGPLVRLWCMRFEAHHQYLKTIANRSRNFKNICHTIVERHQMRKCLEQASDTCLPCDELITSAQSTIDLRSLPQSLHSGVTSHFATGLTSRLISVSSVTIDNVHYSVNDCLIIDTVDEDEPVFLEVLFILSFDGIFCLAGHLLTCSGFNSHYHAYAVIKHSEWIIIQPGQEISYHALDKYTLQTEDGECEFIGMRHVLPCTNGTRILFSEPAATIGHHMQ